VYGRTRWRYVIAGCLPATLPEFRWEVWEKLLDASLPRPWMRSRLIVVTLRQDMQLGMLLIAAHRAEDLPVSPTLGLAACSSSTRDMRLEGWHWPTPCSDCAHGLLLEDWVRHTAAAN
jgi:hypothetical protein